MMPNKSITECLVGTRTTVEDFPPRATNGPPSRALIVDDEALMRWSVAETLSDQGWQVTEAADAASALSVYPDIVRASGIVFLDLTLPDSNDLHVLAAMHRQSPSTPIILMTAHGTPDLVHAARTLGAFAVIRKPFDLNELIPLLEAASLGDTINLGEPAHASGRSI
jgi:DNA-binding NtrC family response regulator